MTQEDWRSYDSPLRDAQTAQTRARIVDAAAREFVRLGYAKTSMSAVAAVAGVVARDGLPPARWEGGGVQSRL